MTDLNLAAVIVTYNSASHIRPCLRSLQESGASTVVVDNGSQDGTLDLVRQEFPDVRVVASGANLGYGAAINFGVAQLGVSQAESDVFLAANADTVFPEGALQQLAGYLRDHPRVGIVGPQQLFPDGSWQRSYGDVQGIWEVAKALAGVTSVKNIAYRVALRRGRSAKPKPVGYVDGAVMMIRRAAFDAVGGFDSAFHYYCEDADFSVRLRRARWGVFTVPSVHVTHLRGGSSTKVEGYSVGLLHTQANAYRQLVNKYHSQGYWQLYRELCLLHARKMRFIYRLLGTVSPSPYSLQASARAVAFERWARIWAELNT